MEQGIALFKSSGNNPDVGNYLGNVMAKLEESAGPIPSKEDGKVRGGIYKYPGKPPVLPRPVCDAPCRELRLQIMRLGGGRRSMSSACGVCVALAESEVVMVCVPGAGGTVRDERLQAGR